MFVPGLYGVVAPSNRVRFVLSVSGDYTAEIRANIIGDDEFFCGYAAVIPSPSGSGWQLQTWGGASYASADDVESEIGDFCEQCCRVLSAYFGVEFSSNGYLEWDVLDINDIIIVP